MSKPLSRRIIAIDGEGKTDHVDQELIDQLQKELLTHECISQTRRPSSSNSSARTSSPILADEFAGVGTVAVLERVSRELERDESGVQRQCDQCDLLTAKILRADSPAHRYTLLASSEGNSVAGADLSTVQCFEFLLGLPKGLKCGFAINYDVNMWLRDLDEATLQCLWSGKTPHGKNIQNIRWGDYKISWQPGKKFSIWGSPRRVIIKGKRRTLWDRSCVIYDVWGFFQGTFVKALLGWQVGSPEVWERIQVMKLQRSAFSSVDDGAILAYCLEECRLLAELVQKLITTTDLVDIPLSSYHGAGAAAAALLKRESVKNYLPSTLPVEVATGAQHAYFGGRFETALLGEIGNAYAYDINSAYPYALQDLPCLACCSWDRSCTVERDGLYLVKWNLRMRPVFGPLPWRSEKNRISFPSGGEGWYYGAEVAAAQRLHGDAIRVLDGWVVRRGCEHKPFGFVPAVYQQRLALAKAKSLGEKVLKLALNSCYGKLAQSVGFRGQPPPYRCMIWAGMVTAQCRAMILDAIRLGGGSVVSIATDGVLSTTPLELDEQNERLGGWKAETVSDAFIAQNGVYEFVSSDGERKTRSRGFSGREINWPELRAAFEIDRERAIWSTYVRRFIGLGAALARVDMSTWRRWAWSPKTVSCSPHNRTFASELSLEAPDTGPLMTYAPNAVVGMSAAHVFEDEWDQVDSDERRELADQG